MKKTNEAWFGDTFNRDIAASTVSYAIADGAICTCANTADFAVNKSSVNGVYTLAADVADVYTINTQVDTLQDKFKELQKQIEVLKQKQDYVLKTTEVNSLRNTLRTLKYERET